MNNRWPSRLWIVRHGESAGNVAFEAAHASGAARIDVKERNMEVALSDLGHEQARVLGEAFTTQAEEGRPQVILTSTYRRARQTAEAFIAAGGAAQDLAGPCADERLREREFGVLEGLTKSGIETLFPEQFAARASLGKFYHRPPGGESWCDVILRLRSALDTLALHHAGQRVMIVGHQVTTLCLRYLLENLTEQEILAVDAQGEVANCSITEYAARADGTGLELVRYNAVTPMRQAGTTVTAEPDDQPPSP
jgi:probable phosphoglycerate mutase